jgi:hypothetical protein
LISDTHSSQMRLSSIWSRQCQRTMDLISSRTESWPSTTILVSWRK